jgi:glucokinase
MILAGDIGGTHTRLALFENGRLHCERSFPSKKYSGLEEIVQEYLKKENCAVRAASFGIAGAVRMGVCRATNLPWRVDAKEMGRSLGIHRVYLLNDLEANAYGLGVLKEEELVCLQRGDPTQKGNRALISAGTGLGEAGLFWDGKRHLPFACEGGHADFAPRNSLEVELLFALQKQFGHVSYERVISGPGLRALYQFLITTGQATASLEVEEEMKRKDPSATISDWGVNQKDTACSAAVDWFVSLYGAEAGNLALRMLSLGGLYLGGGIAPHLVGALKRGGFLASFLDKGRFSSLLESIPIWVIVNENTALLGAAVFAEQYES